MEEEAKLSLPLRLEGLSEQPCNPQLSKRIEIVETDNHKVSVPVHEGLLKANSSHAKQDKTL